MGEPSIIFGMQSFGGRDWTCQALYESLFITSCPCSRPMTGWWARAEWRGSSGRKPLQHGWKVATAIRLWPVVGRAIPDGDQAPGPYCYDRRLTGTSYDQLLIRGCPSRCNGALFQCLDVLSEARLHC